MTATPIPRTLALILYGDLDISIIDELPPNRKEIETYAVTKGMETRVNNFVRKQVQEGRQAYIVCPLVEENEDKKYIRRERSVSECTRDFYVGDIDESSIKASFKDGILTISVPKEEDKKDEIKHISID